MWLEELAPPRARQSTTIKPGPAEDNADAHLKRQIVEREVVAITKGKLDFGPWEQIFYGDLTDGDGSGCW